MATHSNILAWKIPWAVESGRLQAIRSQRLDTIDHSCITEIAIFQTSKFSQHFETLHSDMLHFSPALVPLSLGNLMILHSLEVTILMPNIVQTPNCWHRALQPRTPGLKILLPHPDSTGS